MLIRHPLRCCFAAGIIAAFGLCHGAADRSPIAAAFSPNGTHLAVADDSGRQVQILDTRNHTPGHTIKLDGPPKALAWSSDGSHLFAAESGAGTIAVVDAASGKILRRISTGRYPSGLAIAHDRGLLVVSDSGLDRLCIIDLASGRTTTTIPTGRQPSSVAITRDASLAVVSNLIPATAANDPAHASEVTIVDLRQLKAIASIKLPTGSTNSRSVAISPDGQTAYVTHTLGRFHLPTTQLDRGWVNTNALSMIDLKRRALSGTVLLDQVTDGAADPWGVAVDPSGKWIFVSLSGVHELAIIDRPGLEQLAASTDQGVIANDLSLLHRHGLIRRVPLPAKGPRGLAASGDGSRIAICGYFSGNVVMLDDGGNITADIPLGEQPEPSLVRRGEFAYHDADHCFQRWLSCSSCHPDARADGLNWDLLNDGIGNSKNARSMLLSHATPPMMSLGVRKDMETAVNAGFIHIQFSEPDPQRVEAVIAYLSSLEAVASPHRNRDGSLTDSATRGKALFHSDDVGCSSCHDGPHLTNLGMFDVGTSTPRDRGATEFDTPTLREAWRTPPYLHDGRAATLREVVTTHNPGDKHGNTSSLTCSEIDDLVAYLLSL